MNTPAKSSDRKTILKYLSELDVEVRYARLGPTTYPKHYMARTTYNDKNANALTKAIVDFLNNSGHLAERVRSEGRMVDNRKKYVDVLGQVKTIGSTKWIKSTTMNGTADVSATIGVQINGKFVGISAKWEVKMRDKQSEVQKSYESKVNEAGGHYFLVHNIEEFWQQYHELLEQY